jgi:hypothetical protein
MALHVVRLVARHAVRVMAVIVDVIVAAAAESFIVHRSVVESDSVAVGISESFIVHRSVVEGDSVAVLITESELQEAVIYLMV